MHVFVFVFVFTFFFLLQILTFNCTFILLILFFTFTFNFIRFLISSYIFFHNPMHAISFYPKNFFIFFTFTLFFWFVLKKQRYINNCVDFNYNIMYLSTESNVLKFCIKYFLLLLQMFGLDFFFLFRLEDSGGDKIESKKKKN